ncbi:MAG: septum formation initiator family protein [Prevotellaceae bacterium]|nr:septum formation initiator family protein [Prevotellaceae bacterium]
MIRLAAVWTFIGRYKYLITVVVLGAFAVFGGEDSLWANYKRQREIDAMKDNLQTLGQNYERDSLALSRLVSDPKEAEHVAREVYLMKRAGEDIYLFVDTDEKGDSSYTTPTGLKKDSRGLNNPRLR